MIDIQREIAPETPPKPNAWRPVTLEGLQTARLTCPNGHSWLLDDHEIADDGQVSPSVECHPFQDECDFHHLIKLTDWGKVRGSTGGEGGTGGTPTGRV